MMGILRPRWQVDRLPRNPVIVPSDVPFETDLPPNANGPALVRVPDWVTHPLGRYYLYFAHHGGRSIRLAYGDDLESGRWRVWDCGVVSLAGTPFKSHLASPDLWIDRDRQQLRLYFHGDLPGGGQGTIVALSRDGLCFTIQESILGPAYFRVFEYGGAFYAIAKKQGGWLLRSPDGLTQWQPSPTPGPLVPQMRHGALWREGDRLWLVYSRVGDFPERLLLSSIDLRGDWTTWEIAPPIELLAPALGWEGADLPVQLSAAGPAYEPRHELRDPAVYWEGDRGYLCYSIAGEQGLAIARLTRSQPN